MACLLEIYLVLDYRPVGRLLSGWVRVSGEGANKLAPQARDSRGAGA